MAKKFKSNPYISCLRNIKDIDQKINLAYKLKDEDKIYIYMVDAFYEDDRKKIKYNPLCKQISQDISFLVSRGYDVHQVYEPKFDLILFFVEHDDTLIKLLSNLKLFKR